MTGFDRARDVVEQVLKTLGRLDVLVNNAGIHPNEVIWAMIVR